MSRCGQGNGVKGAMTGTGGYLGGGVEIECRVHLLESKVMLMGTFSYGGYQVSTAHLL